MKNLRKMRDRLLEMQQLAGIEAGSNGKKKLKKNDSVQPLLGNTFEQFLSKVETMRHALTSLDNDREMIRRMQGNILQNGGDVRANRELNENVDRFIQRSRILKEKLMKLINNDSSTSDEVNCGTSRVRNEQIRVLNFTFETIIMKFNEEQIEYKEKASKKIVDYFRMQNIEVSSEQIDEAIESGNLFALTRNLHMANAEKKMLCDDVKHRADEIVIIEKQIREVADLFHDMHLLVVQQGETLDRIETSVMNAEEYTQKANENVKQAIVSRRRNNKLKCLAIILIIILITILFVIFQSFVCIYTPIC